MASARHADASAAWVEERITAIKDAQREVRMFLERQSWELVQLKRADPAMALAGGAGLDQMAFAEWRWQVEEKQGLINRLLALPWDQLDIDWPEYAGMYRRGHWGGI